MSQIKLINFSGRTIKLGEPVKLHATNKNSFDYAPLGSFGLIGTAAEQITFGSWGLINLLGTVNLGTGTSEVTLVQLQQIITSVIAAEVELFSTTDTTSGVVPGSNNLSDKYFLNAKRGWVIPTQREPDLFNFVDDAMPTITNYNAVWRPIWGPHPIVRCVLIDSANLRHHIPIMTQYTYVNGMLEAAYYDFGTAQTGYLILSK